MGIGTSLGAHFEDEFQHQAGVPTLPKGDEEMVKKPKDTGDDNVLPPDEGTYDSTKGLTRVSVTKADETSTPDVGESWGEWLTKERPPLVRHPLTDQIFGLNNTERFKFWPERMVEDLLTTAGKVSKGEVPMWAMTPDGEFHTSIEGLEAARKLMPAANGGIFPRIHMRGEGLKALETYHEAPYETGAHEQFLQMVARIRRQPSNIVEGEVLPPEATRQPAIPQAREAHIPRDPFEQQPFDGPPAFGYETAQSEARHIATQFARDGEVNPYLPDRFRGRDIESLNDAEFYDYGQYQSRGSMTREQEARWYRIDREEAATMERDLREYEDHYSQHDISTEARDWSHAEAPARESPRFWGKETSDQVNEAVKGSELKLIKQSSFDNRNHQFKFANKDGIGKLDITEKKGGKELYVDIIGRVNQDGFVDWRSAQTFGGKEIKQLVKQLMDEFPKAEEITGFRVSGARVISGQGEAKASMKLPGRGKLKKED